MNNSLEKILFYIDTMYRGGAQRVMANLVNYFAEQKYDVILVNDFRQGMNEKVYSISDQVIREYLSEVNAGNPIVKNIKRICRLRKIIRGYKPDIVLSFLGKPNERLLLATLGMNVKKIVSVRNDPNREYGSGKMKKFLTGELFKLADGCVFQTEEAKTYFPKSVQKKSTVIYNPVAQEFFDIRRCDKVENIVTCGRLEKQKNHYLLINAFRLLADEFPNEKLYIYGEGSLRKEYEHYIQNIGLADRIFLPGNISNVQDMLAKAKIFVLSSDYEGMPNALMEALAVGVPSIATDCPCGGPRELIVSGKNGLLCECGNVEELADKLKKVLIDDDFRMHLGVRARKMAKEYRAENVLECWKEYLKLQ